MHLPNKLLREQIDSYDEDIVVRDLAYDIFLQSKQDNKKELKFYKSDKEFKLFRAVYSATGEGHQILGHALDPEKNYKR